MQSSHSMQSLLVSSLLLSFFVLGQNNVKPTVQPHNLTDVTSTTVQQGGSENKLDHVSDCLGLGRVLSTKLELIFKKDENGTSAQQVRFHLRSRLKPLKVEVVIGDQFGLEWTDFDIRRDTIIIVHGFLSTGEENWIEKMADAFLLKDDINVVSVDWSDSGNTFNYYKAVVNTRTTGNQIATLFGQIANYSVKNKVEISKEKWGKIHCVGHSLGSHICGYAAYEIKRRKADWIIQRITGLDPAQPCFSTADLNLKLDKSDAPFVDIIHTNGRYMLQMGLGLPESIGHMDFFPNGGQHQPGCDLKKNIFIPGINIPREAIHKAVCSHGRAYVYLTESIMNLVTQRCSFWAHSWDKTFRGIEHILTHNCSQEEICVEMGINSVNYNYKGIFFTPTTSFSPYCNSEDLDIDELKKEIKQDFTDTLSD